MNILHYTLGLPPYRSGGLTKYATDLMLAQSVNGNVVTLIYPGDYTFWRFPILNVKREGGFKGISVYEIKNPSPVPLLHGVREPSDIYKPRHTFSEKALEKIYDEIQPDVMHLHTLMGLPPELVKYFKSKGTRIVFTSHDYYGLCSKVNFINRSGEFCDAPSGKNCALCNYDAPGSTFLRIRNSKSLLKHKEQFAHIAIKLKTKKNIHTPPATSYPSEDLCAEYSALIHYYHRLFKLVDCFHFNSAVSKSVYELFVTPKESIVLPISHANISDVRKLKKFDMKHLRLAFIGGTAKYKGFPMLKRVLIKLNHNGVLNWMLNVWGGKVGTDTQCNKINYKGKYEPDDLENVFNETDLLIVPSIWKETFSLITLEALSFGVPVLVSENVGAKDIVKGYNPDFVFYPSEEDLYTKLHGFLSNPLLLEYYNQKICAGKFEYSLNDHIKKIQNLYTHVLM